MANNMDDEDKKKKTDTQELKNVKFLPFSSCMDPGFWNKLCQQKLNEYRLSEDAIPIKGYYCNYLAENLPSFLNIDHSAWDIDDDVGTKHYKVLGSLKILNTIEDFKNFNYTKHLEDEGRMIWSEVMTKGPFKDPSLLNRFSLVTFPNLKKFTFHYWCLFPSLCPNKKFTIEGHPVNVNDCFSLDKMQKFVENYDKFKNELLQHQQSKNSCCAFLIDENDMNVHPFSYIQSLNEEEKKDHKIMLGFADPSTANSKPGWSLRNLLVLLSTHCYDLLNGKVRVLCLRDRTSNGVRHISHSIVLNVCLVRIDPQSDCPNVIGWERNSKEQLGPRFLDLSSGMDPYNLSESAVDLNLKLMKWRLVPDLDLEVISNSRCLLLGSGTLGCNVARCLLGWGVRNITFVDNARVSYSNPVRQSLFNFSDCLDGGKPKVACAAASIKQIFPLANAVGINLFIPMPGHPIPGINISQLHDSTCQDITHLIELIRAHDVIFLLMDTRESRWLPTLLGRSMEKIVLNVALGFDSYLIMRHGVGFSEVTKSDGVEGAWKVVPGSQLGCYFCNDIFSPGNSHLDRSLDQQCTVTRLGVPYVAASLAVELLVSLLNHPLKGQASAEIVNESVDGLPDSKEVSILGAIPHQIRGFLSNFCNIMPVCRSFNMCTACSQPVLEAYKRDGIEFLVKSINEPSSLEELTGLTKLHTDTKDIKIEELSDNEVSD
ncbi:hypothetical protein HELRODRAFT_105102 [Helobdella robusta]|uniref:Ubiquitin-like modifier-activating enzyme ATG7 n=1 Tax=Helobdella robusta TaxID=6412 RepID=T1EDQ8_HELRO|nr:hypothetical protein HELRODRAFT_105102 [Helobdella robusta]ESO04833.1 hypothetical protein HELRODRAFT_105102 [Helobdella robusta]